ncbi:LLM class flavin-dependent oxidoreductase [Rhodococcus sp. OK302]|uniref:LLM class flavin-dependent oxidoreductase n=1 Tax=Rhodococcus sp. OK302 TaxID=1882769 RepID=UPI000B944499|nr:LLM class flavin-dependent oxidoreductase [Rhodococcus sp. OK302]OYD70387.1 limonene 1,2-monooxygenase [Rhodococcus sp. OK302]
MKFGIFMSPYHIPGKSPSVSLAHDLDIIEHMDRLGYDEAWIGEHHSGGFEIVSAPDLLIAAAAQRTSDIRFGTGVTSVPYHHPLVAAGRITLLDNITRGRFIFGAGPGALVTDAHMMGIEPNNQRRMMEEGLDAISRLIKGETVDMETDWFTLQDARLQVLPYKGREVEIAVASVRSPSGVKLAGRYGFGLLSIAATDPNGGFSFVGETWRLMEERAKESGQSVSRDNWRVMAPIHIAETKEQAYEDVRHGMVPMAKFGSTGPFAAEGMDIEQVLAATTHEEMVDNLNTSGAGVVGTPEMAIELVSRLEKQSGGFGTLLLAGSDWANQAATKKSLELFAQYVIPEFQGTSAPLLSSWDRLYSGRKAFGAEFRAAQDKAIADDAAERTTLAGAVPTS